jgi:hypothetical protein
VVQGEEIGVATKKVVEATEAAVVAGALIAVSVATS